MYILTLQIFLPCPAVVPGVVVEGRVIDVVGDVTAVAFVTVVEWDSMDVVWVWLVSPVKWYSNGIRE